MATDAAPQKLVKTSDFIVRFLHESGVKQVFELSGGMIAHLLDSFYEHGKIDVVSMHHEQSAAFAADAVGRITGLPGVALATSGPGACNLLTGIGSCYFDSSPAVFITGQVNRSEQKGNRSIRQLGFQETDIVDMARPITKAAWCVTSSSELPSMLLQAFHLATTGRPGPVLLDIPMDVQRESISLDALQPFQRTIHGAKVVDEETLNAVVEALCLAKRPLLLVGGGVHASKSAELVRRLAEATSVPVINSLMAVDVLPNAHPLRVGMIGSYGNRWANFALAQSDLLLVLGSRLDIRQTGADTNYFKEGREVIHVDCEAGEINNRILGCRPILADLHSFVARILEHVATTPLARRDDWLGKIAALKSKFSDILELREATGINPNVFMHALSRASYLAGSIVTDVGQHQMWAAQSTELLEGQRWLTSGGMGAMGFSLPAAIGAAIETKRPSVVIAGDGAFQCNIQELQTVVRRKLPIKIVIMNNHCLGMVRQFQESYFHGHYQSTYWGYSAPDFARVAEAYGIPSRSIAATTEVPGGIAFLWKNPSEPALLDVSIDTFTQVYPKIAFGKPLTEMEPDAKPIEMEST